MLHKSQLFCAAIPLVAMIGCSGTDASPAGNGGANAVGGAVSVSGGASSTGGLASSGGAVGNGGAANVGGRVSSGGAVSTGGIASVGGAVATGGTRATGGSKAATGGSSALGGATATGGVNSTGGARVLGGSSNRGGANAVGGTSSKGGASTGGVSSSIGGTSAGGSGGASLGCGVATSPPACSTSGAPCSIDVSGTNRTYYVVLPTNYVSSQSYPVVFGFHYRGGTAEQILNGFYGIRTNFPNAIYVSPQGLTASGSTGWPNTNGQDVAFTKAMISSLSTNYCVDKARIFSAGFSYGGMMSFALGCEMGDVFRAIAPMSGALYSGCKNGTHAIAMWGSHGLSDDVVPIADGRAGRDAILARNHCGTQTTATTPSPCVTYEGCDSGYPTTWCEFEGGHTSPNFAGSAIATFFKQF